MKILYPEYRNVSRFNPLRLVEATLIKTGLAEYTDPEGLPKYPSQGNIEAQKSPYYMKSRLQEEAERKREQLRSGDDQQFPRRRDQSSMSLYRAA